MVGEWRGGGGFVNSDQRLGSTYYMITEGMQLEIGVRRIMFVETMIKYRQSSVQTWVRIYK